MTVLYGNFGQTERLSGRQLHPVDYGSDASKPENLGIAPVIALAAPVQPRALEHVQGGVNMIAQFLGQRVTVTSVTGADYFMRDTVGLGLTYVAGRAGMSDFSDSLLDAVNTNAEVGDTGNALIAAHRLYGAYCVGRELLRSVVPAKDPTFKRKLDGYRGYNPRRTLFEAQQAVYSRLAATVALVGIKDVLDRPSQRALLGVIKSGGFPSRETTVANDFRYHIGGASLEAMLPGMSKSTS